MAKNIETPADLKFGTAATDGKKGPHFVNLMKPGPGTPWEDRGQQGAIGAFIKTVVESFIQPGWLVDSMRRPETTADATAFAMTCAAFWSIGSLINSYLSLKGLEESHEVVNVVMYWFMHAIRALIVPFVAYVVLSLASKFYYQLASADMKNKAPPELVYNIFCYAMGPSILAPAAAFLPKVGMWAVVAWIVLNVMYMGKKRLFIPAAASIIAAALATLICAAILVGIYILGGYALFYLNLSPVETPVNPSDSY